MMPGVRNRKHQKTRAPWRAVLRRLKTLEHINRRHQKGWEHTIVLGLIIAVGGGVVAGLVLWGMEQYVLPEQKPVPVVLAERVEMPPEHLPPQPSVPVEKRVAVLDIQLTDILKLYGSNPATARLCIKVVNIGDFEASNARIIFQHHDTVGGWLGALTSWITCDGNQILRYIKFPPKTQFISMLTSESREGVETFLAEGNKLYFAAQIEWNNPNGQPDCILRYIEISRIPSGEGPNATLYFMKLLKAKELPKGIAPAPIAACAK